MLGPILYDLDAIERACGAQAAAYAARKQQGGQSNQSGASFEIAYAANRMALAGGRACREPESNEDVWFQAQTGGFVDDLAVVTAQKRTLTQARSGHAQWTGGDHPLEDDFRMQRQLDQQAGYPASYELVVASDEHAKLMRASRPDDLAEVEVNVFSYVNDHWLDLIGARPDLQEALDTISLRQPLPIHREQTFQLILGWWVHHGCRGSLRTMMLELAERPDALVRVPGPDYVLSGEVAAALANVPGFAWSIRGRSFFFQIGALKGWAAFLCGSDRFRRFERFMLEEHPTEWKRVVEELRTESDDDR